MNHALLINVALAAGLAGGAWAAGPSALTSNVRVPVVTVGAQAATGGFVLEPVRQTTVSAQAQGRIVSLHVKAGDTGRAAACRDHDREDRCRSCGCPGGRGEAQLRRHHIRAQLRAQGFVSQAALDTAEAQLRAAQAGRDQAGAGARQSALAQGFTRVTAAFDGYVRETLAETGDLAVPGKPILRIHAPQPLRAVVQVGASRLELARQAARPQVQLPDGRWVEPASQQILNVVDPVSQTVEWRLDLAEKLTGALVPGQQVRVRFAGMPAPAGASQRLTLPAAAVLRRGELTAVYVASPRGFSLRAIRLGSAADSASVDVLAGLAAGERVALDPVRAGLTGALPDDPASSGR
jgi:RND family efflux transporter MFP subunit